MATGYYERDSVTTTRPLRVERDYLMAERFYPGEFGWVAVLAVASLLVYSLAIWGLVSEVPRTISYNMSSASYAGPSMSDYSYTTPYTTPDTNPLTPDATPMTPSTSPLTPEPTPSTR